MSGMADADVCGTAVGRQDVFEPVKAGCKQVVFRAIAGAVVAAVPERPGLHAIHALLARGAPCFNVFLSHCLTM